MHEKGIIKDIVPWKKARRFFYWRLRRRLLETEAVGRIVAVQKDCNHKQAEAMLRRWFVEDKGTTEAYLWDDNGVVVDWLQNQLNVSPELLKIIRSIQVRCVWSFKRAY